MKILFVDYLNFYSTLNILYEYPKYDEIRIISDLKYSSRLWSSIITFFGVKIHQEEFFFGEIFNDKGESIYLDSRRIASEKSLQYSKWLLSDSFFSNYVKSDSQSIKVLKLFISKTVWNEMEYFIRRVMYIKYTYPEMNKYSMIIRFPGLINSEYLQSLFQEFNLIFNWRNRTLIIKKILFSFMKKVLSFRYLFFKNKIKENMKSTVSIAVDTISLNKNQRAFPHWFQKSEGRKFYILNFKKFKIDISKENLIKNNIEILNCNYNNFYASNHRKLSLSNNHRIPPILKLEIKMFLSLANGMDNLLRELNCDKFIFLDPQDPITDAVQIISKKIRVETTCIQFTNMGMKVPLMMTMADKFLTFSKIYNKVFTWKDIGPNKFYPIGYSFKSDEDRSLKDIRLSLLNKGVKKIIIYFDESVQNDKWGLISQQQYLNHLNTLAETVINNKQIAIVLKPQFTFNTIKRYNSQIILKAIGTKRFIELNQGYHRNIYTPSNAAQIADYCISDLIGATAAIECAVSNKKVLLINPNGFIPEFQSIYEKSNVIFPSLKNALKNILRNEENTGDWSKIINKFVAFNDGKEVSRIQNI